MHKDTHANTHRDKGTTHSHTFTSWHKCALQCHIFRKPFLNISLQQPSLFTYTHLYTSPPFLPSPSPLYASSHSSLHFSLMTPLKWLIKNPKHLYMDPFLYLYRDILLRYSASLNPISYSCLETLGSLGFVISHFVCLFVFGHARWHAGT